VNAEHNALAAAGDSLVGNQQAAAARMRDARAAWQPVSELTNQVVTGVTDGANGAAAKSIRALKYLINGNPQLAAATAQNVLNGIGHEAFTNPVPWAMNIVGLGAGGVMAAGKAGAAMSRISAGLRAAAGAAYDVGDSVAARAALQKAGELDQAQTQLHNYVQQQSALAREQAASQPDAMDGADASDAWQDQADNEPPAAQASPSAGTTGQPSATPTEQPSVGQRALRDPAAAQPYETTPGPASDVSAAPSASDGAPDSTPDAWKPWWIPTQEEVDAFAKSTYFNLDYNPPPGYKPNSFGSSPQVGEPPSSAGPSVGTSMGGSAGSSIGSSDAAHDLADASSYAEADPGYSDPTENPIQQLQDDPLGLDQDAADNAAVGGSATTTTDDSSSVGSSGVQLVNGRRPINSKYAGQYYPLPPDLQAKYPDGVIFKDTGYPDFSPYATETTRIEYTGSRKKDEGAANQNVGLQNTPEGSTWHHHEDGATMQLVPEDLHTEVRHTGGFAAANQNQQEEDSPW
jgi:hypothetical protein